MYNNYDYGDDDDGQFTLVSDTVLSTLSMVYFNHLILTITLCRKYHFRDEEAEAPRDSEAYPGPQ